MVGVRQKNDRSQIAHQPQLIAITGVGDIAEAFRAGLLVSAVDQRQRGNQARQHEDQSRNAALARNLGQEVVGNLPGAPFPLLSSFLPFIIGKLAGADAEERMLGGIKQALLEQVRTRRARFVGLRHLIAVGSGRNGIALVAEQRTEPVQNVARQQERNRHREDARGHQNRGPLHG